MFSQLRIVAKFKAIRNLAVSPEPAHFETLQGEEAADWWDVAAIIRAHANEILSLLCAIPEEEVDVQDR